MCVCVSPDKIILGAVIVDWIESRPSYKLQRFASFGILRKFLHAKPLLPTA